MGRLEEGLWVLLQYDLYGREQDIAMARGCDIDYDRRGLAFTLGVASRGESVKTGTYQGVLVHRGAVADLALALRGIAGMDLMMKIDTVTLRKAWARACRVLAVEHTGPLHTIRHTAPTEDLARRRIDLEGARRRGRWKQMASVQRYTR